MSAERVFGDLTIAPLPADTAADAAFVLIKLTNGEWCARSVGGDAYNRVEFLGQLSSYTHSLLQDEAAGWLADEDRDT